MYSEWYGVCDFVVLLVVEVCADYVGVNMFHVCLNFGAVYGFGGVVVVYPLPWPLLVGGVRCSRLWSTSQLLRPSGQQCSHSGGVCPQIQGRQCGAYVGAVEEMMCVVCVDVQRGHSGDGCVLASTLCK